MFNLKKKQQQHVYNLSEQFPIQNLNINAEV